MAPVTLLSKTKMVLSLTSGFMNQAVSFFVFCFLDVVDLILCVVYKVADFFIEAEWKPCYCSSSSKEAITGSGKILVSEHGKSKIVCVSSSTKLQLQLEEISDTLYTRPSLVSEVSSQLSVNELLLLKRSLPKDADGNFNANVNDDHAALQCSFEKKCNKIRKGTVRSSSAFTVNSTIVEMLQGKIGRQEAHPIPRWSDCDCQFCTSWTSSTRDALFVKRQLPEPTGEASTEDVLFIHGFISSSAFWTETLFPNFSSAARSRYRLFAVDLLGFGRSPKPTDSLYTVREHLEMIEKSVIEANGVESFHIVAHSLGCILALALAVRYPRSVKSLTLLAPPYYPVPKGAQATQYVMRKVAPRRVWPLIAFGASMACWYEHISRTICLLICKNHRVWEFLAKLFTRNRMRTFLLEGFFCHTHNAAWHTLHNIICGTASRLDGYLDAVRDRLDCDVNIYHGEDDEVIPVECSYDVQRRIPRARVKVIRNKDHITIVVGRQKSFARELEHIWSNTNSNSSSQSDMCPP